MSKLLTDDLHNPVAWKILISAKLAGQNIETISGVDAKGQDFEKKSPVGKLPILETPQGTIFEANAAARYLAIHTKVLGANDFESAQVDNWCEFAASEIDLPASVWIFPILGYIQNNPVATQRAKGDIRKILEILDKHLADRTFLVGERLTLADVVVATSLHRLYEKVLDPAFRKQFVNANRWFTTVVNQPEYLSVAGPVVLASKMEAAPKGEAVAEEVKEAKPAKKEPKKEVKAEKPKVEAKPAPATEEEVDDDGVPIEPKKKSKLDLLPPSKMVMDDWKRVYSNEETRSKALPWLWENFDREGYSVWFSDYKYNNELSKVFMTANLMNGFLQRLDKVRKYGFGSLIMFGQDGDLEISACWLFRGKEIPEEMTECDDAEHYTWTQANLDDPATKELINDYFAWDGKFGGKTQPFNQGKIFK